MAQQFKQEEMRLKFKNFVDRESINQAALSRKLGLHSNTLATFKSGSCDLSQKNLEALNKFIERSEELWKTT